ncbi:universal stress protein [Geopsychrobacter electrodiphilus]|uniref:universal stress protein n=1 Tax=Geopsychrobacter electrodiphilus TaxID=225196 RepID=UPI0003605EA9|nr:universal stress protein [Geopsychrobacter electrodiphilus]
MDFKNVLVLTDFSKDSEDALQDAVKFAEKFGSHLTILHVVQDESSLSFVLSNKEYRSLEDRLDLHAKQMFVALEEKVPGLKALNFTTKTRKGIPYINCLYEIESGDYDLVFAGSRGRSDMKHIFVGSTAEKIMRRSPISVFMTRSHL